MKALDLISNDIADVVVVFCFFFGEAVKLRPINLSYFISFCIWTFFWASFVRLLWVDNCRFTEQMRKQYRGKLTFLLKYFFRSFTSLLKVLCERLAPVVSFYTFNRQTEQPQQAGWKWFDPMSSIEFPSGRSFIFSTFFSQFPQLKTFVSRGGLADLPRVAIPTFLTSKIFFFQQRKINNLEISKIV